MRVFLCEKPSQGKDIAWVCWAPANAATAATAAPVSS